MKTAIVVFIIFLASNKHYSQTINSTDIEYELRNNQFDNGKNWNQLTFFNSSQLDYHGMSIQKGTKHGEMLKMIY